MVVHRAMLRRIYDWCIDAAHKPYAMWMLAAVAFAESSFFPVPPDVMLIPMSLARPQRAWLYALVCTATSVVGGILGYAIGALLYDSIGQWLINLYRLGDKVKVQVVRVNMDVRQIDLGLVEILERVRDGERGPRRSKASPKREKLQELSDPFRSLSGRLTLLAAPEEVSRITARNSKRSFAAAWINRPSKKC